MELKLLIGNLYKKCLVLKLVYTKILKNGEKSKLISGLTWQKG